MAITGFGPNVRANQPIHAIIKCHSSLVVAARLNLLDCKEIYFPVLSQSVQQSQTKGGRARMLYDIQYGKFFGSKSSS